MRLARLSTPAGPVSGRYDDGVVYADDGRYEVGVDGNLLAPCDPSAIYCVGRNYAATIEQMEYERPDEPDFFIKPPASLLGHGESIAYPDFTEELTYAGELAAVIDERCRSNRRPTAPTGRVTPRNGWRATTDIGRLRPDRAGETGTVKVKSRH